MAAHLGGGSVRLSISLSWRVAPDRWKGQLIPQPGDNTEGTGEGLWRSWQLLGVAGTAL